jgi:hypothetical protein
MQNNILTKSPQFMKSLFSLKIERGWVYLLGFIAVCKMLTLLFAAQAIIFSGVGAGIVVFWLLALWKAEQKVNVRAEFREMRLTGGAF